MARAKKGVPKDLEDFIVDSDESEEEESEEVEQSSSEEERRRPRKPAK